MNEQKQKMIRTAKQQYAAIYPCASKKNLGECFTFEENQIVFWFNTADSTTHVLTQKLSR
jgi:hypothetical protein